MSIFDNIKPTNKSNDLEIEKLKEQIKVLETKVNNEKAEKSSMESGDLVEIYYKWKSPSRTFVLHSKQWFLLVAGAFLVVILIMAFLQEITFIIVLICLLVLVYGLATIPPDQVDHEITNRGIRSIGKLYYWDELEEYYITVKNGVSIVNVRTNLKFPSKIQMLVNELEEKIVTRILSEHLKYRESESKQGWLNKVSDGENKNITPKMSEKYSNIISESQATTNVEGQVPGQGINITRTN